MHKEMFCWCCRKVTWRRKGRSRFRKIRASLQQNNLKKYLVKFRLPTGFGGNFGQKHEDPHC